MQSIIAVAYVHESALTGVEYISFDHDDEILMAVSQTGSEQSDKFHIDDLICHHCHHFVGVLNLLTNDSLRAILPSEKPYEHGFILNSSLVSPHLRPPIL